jgi:drug/metabolite transporter (DMT)-like permease
MLLRDFTPTEIMFFRFFLAYFALLLARPKRIPKNLSGGAALCMRRPLGCCSVLYAAEHQSRLYPRIHAGDLVSVAPFFTAILSWFLLKGGPLHKSFFVGFGAAIIGVALISFNGNFILKLNPLGDILAIPARQPGQPIAF